MLGLRLCSFVVRIFCHLILLFCLWDCLLLFCLRFRLILCVVAIISSGMWGVTVGRTGSSFRIRARRLGFFVSTPMMIAMLILCAVSVWYQSVLASISVSLHPSPQTTLQPTNTFKLFSSTAQSAAISPAVSI